MNYCLLINIPKIYLYVTIKSNNYTAGALRGLEYFSPKLTNAVLNNNKTKKYGIKHNNINYF